MTVVCRGALPALAEPFSPPRRWILTPLGDFRLGTRLGSAPRSEDCFAYTDRQPPETQHPVYLWSSHPASYDIRILPNPIDDPGTVDIIGFGNADPNISGALALDGRRREGRLATSAWPRACFVIPEHPDDTSYVVEVEATSFLGETASRTYIFAVPGKAVAHLSRTSPSVITTCVPTFRSRHRSRRRSP